MLTLCIVLVCALCAKQAPVNDMLSSLIGVAGDLWQVARTGVHVASILCETRARRAYNSAVEWWQGPPSRVPVLMPSTEDDLPPRFPPRFVTRPVPPATKCVTCPSAAECPASVCDGLDSTLKM
jgi:hypothetical protein